MRGRGRRGDEEVRERMRRRKQKVATMGDEGYEDCEERSGRAARYMGLKQTNI